MTPITLVRNYRKMNKRWEDAAQTVPCGKCILCLKRRQNNWSFRLMQEMKISSSAFFVTLTYEQVPTSFNGNPTLNKRDFQLFMKRLRKNSGYGKLKYYACGEYGDHSGRPHYHAIIYNATASTFPQDLQNAWGLGHTHIGECDLPTVRYTCKYIMKGKWQPIGELDDREPQFSLQSKGLGKSYLTPQMIKFHKQNLIPCITGKNGQLQSLPRYYKDKIFTTEEKKILAEQGKELAEYKFEKLFDDAYHELIWKKDQIRQQLKKQKYDTQTI